MSAGLPNPTPENCGADPRASAAAMESAALRGSRTDTKTGREKRLSTTFLGAVSAIGLVGAAQAQGSLRDRSIRSLPTSHTAFGARVIDRDGEDFTKRSGGNCPRYLSPANRPPRASRRRSRDMIEACRIGFAFELVITQSTGPHWGRFVPRFLSHRPLTVPVRRLLDHTPAACSMARSAGTASTPSARNDLRWSRPWSVERLPPCSPTRSGAPSPRPEDMKRTSKALRTEVENVRPHDALPREWVRRPPLQRALPRGPSAGTRRGRVGAGEPDHLVI